jgi:hypothetical protein
MNILIGPKRWSMVFVECMRPLSNASTKHMRGVRPDSSRVNGLETAEVALSAEKQL